MLSPVCLPFSNGQPRYIDRLSTVVLVWRRKISRHPQWKMFRMPSENANFAQVVLDRGDYLWGNVSKPWGLDQVDLWTAGTQVNRIPPVSHNLDCYYVLGDFKTPNRSCDVNWWLPLMAVTVVVRIILTYLLSSSSQCSPSRSLQTDRQKENG